MELIMKTHQIQKTIRGFFVAALLVCGLFCHQTQAAGLITGNITFTDSVNLDTTSAGTATMVKAWSGLSLGLPQVPSDDGDFAMFVTPGAGVTFHAPWSFTSGAISSFWSVGGFTFDLTSSSITSQGSGAVSVDAVGMISGNGFDPTPGTFHFTTQDPSASGLFSFSAAAAAVPEPATVMSFLSGSSLLGALTFIRRRRRV
jgi:hypothetical protein